MKFTIDNTAPAKASQCAAKLAAVIRALPDGGLITCRKLAEKSGYTESYISSICVLIPEGTYIQSYPKNPLFTSF